MRPLALPFPRTSDPAVQQWGLALVDQLRRQTQELATTASGDAEAIAALNASIAEIQAKIAELVDLLARLDGQALLDQMRFIANLQKEMQAVFDATQAGLDAALGASRRFALSAIRNDILGLGNVAQIRVEQQTRLESDYAFASQLEIMLARIGDAEAAIVEERTVRSDGDESFAQQLVSLLARVGQTESAIDEERTVRSTLTTSLAELLTTVRSAIGGQEIAITTLQQAVDGVSAQWGVSINSQGSILGLINLSRQNSYTQFSVVADRFVFAQPGDGPDDPPQPMFAFATVGGVSQWALRGNLIADGTIKVASLEAGAINAIWANILTLQTGLIRSADGKMQINLDAGSIVIDF